MYDPLDEKFRWCIYCKADCWPEPENQIHYFECPFVTGIWPVDEINMMCGICFNPLEDFYMLVDEEATKVVTRPVAETVVTVICIGCATAITLLGVKYD